MRSWSADLTTCSKAFNPALSRRWGQIPTLSVPPKALGQIDVCQRRDDLGKLIDCLVELNRQATLLKRFWQVISPCLVFIEQSMKLTFSGC